MAALLAHLLKWRFRPEARRTGIARHAERQSGPTRPDWHLDSWDDARTLAKRETGLEDLPFACPFTIDEALDPDFWPESFASPAKKSPVRVRERGFDFKASSRTLRPDLRLRRQRRKVEPYAGAHRRGDRGALEIRALGARRLGLGDGVDEGLDIGGQLVLAE